MAKRLLGWMVVGALVGDVLGVLGGGRVISYWVTPPGVTDQDRCVVEVNAALAELAKFQAVCAVGGLVFFLILGILWSRRRSAKAEVAPAPR